MFRFQHVSFGWLPPVFYSADGAAAAAASSVNEPVLQPPGEEWPEGDLPEQMGGPRTLLMPGIDDFVIPTNVAQLWHDIAIEDTRPYLASGQINPTGPLANGGTGKKMARVQLKFDRNSPLVVKGGKQDGEPMTATWTNNPRARGKKDDPKTPYISDLAFLLDICLQDKSRPAKAEDMKATINRYAGRTIRLEHGLTAQCRPDKVRYIAVVLPDGTESNVPDPTGTKGCGKRWYTQSFKNPETGLYDQEIACTCGKQKPEVVAQLQAAGQPVPPDVIVVLRAYESVERFCPPIVVGPAPGQQQV